MVRKKGRETMKVDMQVHCPNCGSGDMRRLTLMALIMGGHGGDPISIDFICNSCMRSSVLVIDRCKDDPAHMIRLILQETSR